MDPKVFFETGQTTGKNVSGNATDTSGETAKQAGRAFKEGRLVKFAFPPPFSKSIDDKDI